MNNRISIITITLNSEEYLEQTIISVLEQSYNNIEYIIIDGGSTDTTLDIIKKYQDKIDHWISEPDNGIADAMNKGLSLATGDYILFLHSDDYLLDATVLHEAAQYVTASCDIFMFNIFLEHDGKRTLAKPSGLTWKINFKTGVFHQSAICSKNLFQKIGDFDTQFRITMDYEFFLRAYREKINAQHCDMPLSLMRLVGISSQRDWKNLRKRFREERLAHNKHRYSLGMKILYQCYWPPYLLYRRIRCLVE
ncbi:MAG: glycosyltransferase [Candidatus Electrothrix sp. AR4]|nr:glycosyltransferase [Candidatus Electrothrix sp. AR4]